MIDVVVPARRPATVPRLLAALAAGDDRPDLVTLVGHEVPNDLPTYGLTVRLLRPGGERWAIGEHDVALRRNVGIWHSPYPWIVGLDDDVVPAANTVAACRRLLHDEPYAWGHHRYMCLPPGPEAAVAVLVRTPPEAGRSRELGVNRWHLFQSCYAGMYAAHRDTLIACGGFDLAFSGRHAGEDQDLCRRMARHVHGRETVFIHEPPFAWHPEAPEPWGPAGWTNLCAGEHDEQSKVLNGQRFRACRACPWLLADGPIRTGEEPVLPFDPDEVPVTEVVAA